MNIKYLNEKLNEVIFTGKVIMIDGPWGSGKTFEVKQFIEKGKGNKYYVSLFGVESFKELTESLYCLLHPAKSRKSGIENVSISLLGNGVSFGVDFSNDKEIEKIKNGKGKTIILDDIERADFSKLHMKNILGYAERLSLQGFAVLLVINSKELKSEDRVAMDEFYEKVVDNKFVIDSCDEEVLANQFKGLNVSFDGVKAYFNSNIRMAKKVRKVFNDLKDLAPVDDRQTLFEICVKTITGLYGKEALETYQNHLKNGGEGMLNFTFFDEDKLPSKELSEKLDAILYSNDILATSDNLSIVKGIALYDYDGDSSFLKRYYENKQNTLYKDYFVLDDMEKKKLFEDQINTILNKGAPEPEVALEAIYHIFEEGYGELVNKRREELEELFCSEFYRDYIMAYDTENDNVRLADYDSLINDVKKRIKDDYNKETREKLKKYIEENDYDKAYKLLKDSAGNKDIDIPELAVFFKNNDYFLDYIDKTMPCEKYWYFVRQEIFILKKNGCFDELKGRLNTMAHNYPENRTLNKRVKELLGSPM